MNPTDTRPLRDFLWHSLSNRAPAEGTAWLQGRLNELRSGESDHILYLTFSAVPRYLGKQPFEPSPGELATADRLRPGFSPHTWTMDRAARIWLLLESEAAYATGFEKRLRMLFDHADMGELVALYSSLPLLPGGERFTGQAVEGVRTNMTVVFDAIALDNPYPADYFSEGAWNQLVLKAAFNDRPLYRIIGMERRANAALARIISDYAHERWAAGRVVSPELWRPVGRFLDEALLQDLQRLLTDKHPLQRQAGALVCAVSDHPGAKALLDRLSPEDRPKAGAGWEQLGREWWAEKGVA